MDLAGPGRLAIKGKFGLDPRQNPPRPKPIRIAADGSSFVRIGRGIDLRLGKHALVLDAILDARVGFDPEKFTGLGSVTDGCGIFCMSRTCHEWAIRNRRPRLVAKVIGIEADEPRYVLLTQPRLQGADRQRRESRDNRREAGLAAHVLTEPGSVECSACRVHNVGEVSLLPTQTSV